MTDQQEIEDLIAEAIDDSMDMDWTSRDGARAVFNALYAEGLLPLMADDQARIDAAWETHKAADPRRNLVKAGALIVAEIERLDRAALRQAGEV